MANAAIHIAGVRELQAALRDADEGSQKKLRLVFNEAAELIAVPTRRLVPTDSGALARSVKSRSGQREAKVQMGGAKVPYAGWIEFGGRLPGGQSRKFIKEGRTMYPTLSRRYNEIRALLQKSLVDLARESGFEAS